ncbi:hypothetical protein, partial [Nitrospira sp. BLG_2]|uniref:hypothetical protein n=1 Tax=Nitrospira sp. BLG_2 TaxID=3397507 RepID=UPI003B9BC489
MGVRQIPTSPLHPKIRFACTDHPITIWARAILWRRYFELIGLRAAPDTVAPPFTKTSNNQIPAVDVLLVWWGLPWAPNDSDPLSAGSVTSAPAGPASVPIPKYGATVLSGLHVPTDHRGVRGPDADVARRHAADSAGPHPGAGFDRLMSVWHTSGKPEGTQSDQTRSAPHHPFVAW